MIIRTEVGFGFAQLENCQKSGRILKCEILKKNLDKISQSKNEFKLRYYRDNFGPGSFNLVGGINITYSNTVKENVFLKIEQPVFTKIDKTNFLAFPTNITSLPIILTHHFQTKMSDKPTICYFIKHQEKDPLYLMCGITGVSESFNINNYTGFKESDIHYKYNFILNSGKMDTFIT